MPLGDPRTNIESLLRKKTNAPPFRRSGGLDDGPSGASRAARPNPTLVGADRSQRLASRYHG